MSDIDLDAIEREIGMLLDGPHVYSRIVPEILAGHARSLIARVREQEQEIAEMIVALLRIGVFQADTDDGSEWCASLEPSGEEPYGSLYDALSAVLAAAEHDGAEKAKATEVPRA